MECGLVCTLLCIDSGSLQSHPPKMVIRPQLFKSWIALSTGQISIQWITQLLVSLTLIHWIVIYLLDIAIHLLNNWGQRIFSLSFTEICLIFLHVFLSSWRE